MKLALVAYLSAFVLSTTSKRQTVASAFSSPNPGPSKLFIGFDLGTSGARISVVEGSDHREVFSDAVLWRDNVYDDPSIWMETVESLLQSAKTAIPSLADSLQSICVSGTSSSCVLIDGANVVNLTRLPARMYNFDVLKPSDDSDPSHGVCALNLIDQFAPDQHTARSATGTLAKLLSWHDQKKLSSTERLCHQSDYVSLRLLMDGGGTAHGDEISVASDWHNCLKLGYDVQQLQWPAWLESCLQSTGIDTNVLPSKVVSPGKPIGAISPAVANRFGIPETTVIVGGTTDSNAAFIAATAGTKASLGLSVVSLGSTLAIKQLSATYVEQANLGVYSHRYPEVLLDPADEEAWLVGGASNVGCAILRQENFSNEELESLSIDIDPNVESPFTYYPLCNPGERFPAADSNKQPVLDPKPESRREYLHGILQGISTVECDGLSALQSLGATPPCSSVMTCGGGARNDVWSVMRQRRLRQALDQDGLVVGKAKYTEASFGAAILAAAAFQAQE